MIYGETLASHPHLEIVRGDIRDAALVARSVHGCDAVIHLACISNDPSYLLDPTLGRSINLDAFEPLVRASRAAGVRRFVYASSSSVYGIKHEPNVTEEMALEPITDYSRCKAACEAILARHHASEFNTIVVRPATLCGSSPRQRLDVIVNIFTKQAVFLGQIKVMGGAQKRPNLHIQDMVAFYRLTLRLDERFPGGTYNVGFANHTVAALAKIVQDVVGPGRVQLVHEPTQDHRSYHISSDKVARELDFRPRHTIEDAVRELGRAMREGRLPNAMTDPRYENVRAMQALKLQ
jgi:nucleoside-diphosphate-sugar epimerase